MFFGLCSGFLLRLGQKCLDWGSLLSRFLVGFFIPVEVVILASCLHVFGKWAILKLSHFRVQFKPFC